MLLAMHGLGLHAVYHLAAAVGIFCILTVILFVTSQSAGLV